MKRGARSRGMAFRFPLLAILPLLLLAVLPCGCGEPDPEQGDTIVARVDGEPVRLSEVERRAGWRLHRARLDVHLVLERETERLIEERLLERRARERGVDVESLLQEAVADIDPVREADVDRYLERNPGDVAIEQARPRIRHYLEEKRRIERRLELLASLREAADVEVLLTPPVRPRSPLDLRGAPSRGPADAPVTIVQFADLRRADSARAAGDLARLWRDLAGQIRVVHRSLPVARDELGLLTAQLLAAALQARGQDGFWALHDRLAASGGVERQADLEAIARALDLDDLLPGLAGDAGALLAVRRDLEHAREAGVGRAPTLFVNGRYLMGLDGPDALRELVREELAAAKARS